MTGKQSGLPQPGLSGYQTMGKFLSHIIANPEKSQATDATKGASSPPKWAAEKKNQHKERNSLSHETTHLLGIQGHMMRVTVQAGWLAGYVANCSNCRSSSRSVGVHRR